MKIKLQQFIIIMIVSIFLTKPNLFARISTLSPWSLQDRILTEKGKCDQSLGIQPGVNGVSPTGADVDTTFETFPYHLTYGLLNKMEIGAGWGLANVDRRNKSAQFGITDLMVAARYRFFDASRIDRMPGLDIETGLALPTASFEKGLGTGGLGISFGCGLVLPLDPVRAHFGLGFRLNTENSDDVQVGSTFSYSAGMTIPWQKSLSLTGELKGFNHSRNKKSGTKTGPTPDEFYLSPGCIWKMNERFQMAGAVLIGLTAHSSDIGFNLELQF